MASEVELLIRALRTQSLEIAYTKRALEYFMTVMPSQALDCVKFFNVSVVGIELLVSGKDHDRLKERIGHFFPCNFGAEDNRGCRRIDSTKIRVGPDPLWLVTLISPIDLNLEAEIRMFGQLRDEYGLGEKLRRALVRQNVLPDDQVDVPAEFVQI